MHTRLADEAYALGGETAADSYLNTDKILEIIETAGIDAVHHGYGFFSENAEFAQAITEKGVTFIGPPVGAIAVMGDKISARQAAEKVGVSGVPGTTDFITSPSEVEDFAAEHGYPVAIKAAYGGGGRGMKVVLNKDEIRTLLILLREKRSPILAETKFIWKDTSPNQGMLKSGSLRPARKCGLLRHQRLLCTKTPPKADRRSASF